MLKQAMAGVLSEKEMDELYGAFDQIGEIIILRIPESLLPKRKIIGKV
ncbi:MAG: class I SAM-dependent methyltransferase family protein, partial [Thaumarchaeota archaeon]